MDTARTCHALASPASGGAIVVCTPCPDHRPTGGSRAALLITASGSAAANAMEASPGRPPLPRDHGSARLLPHRKMVRCLFTREYIGRLTCYQQRPDGQWVHMVDLNPAFADSGRRGRHQVPRHLLPVQPTADPSGNRLRASSAGQKPRCANPAQRGGDPHAPGRPFLRRSRRRRCQRLGRCLRW